MVASRPRGPGQCGTSQPRRVTATPPSLHRALWRLQVPQRRAAGVVLPVDVRAGGDQKLYCAPVAHRRGFVQRRPAVNVPCVDITSAAQMALQCSEVTVMSCLVEGFDPAPAFQQTQWSTHKLGGIPQHSTRPPEHPHLPRSFSSFSTTSSRASAVFVCSPMATNQCGVSEVHIPIPRTGDCQL